MYTLLNLRLGPEIVVPLMCNTEQVDEVIEFAKTIDGNAVDIIEEIECKFDCRTMEVTDADPFGWNNEDTEPNDNFIEVRVLYPDGNINDYTISEGVAEMIQEIMEKE